MILALRMNATGSWPFSVVKRGATLCCPRARGARFKSSATNNEYVLLPARAGIALLFGNVDPRRERHARARVDRPPARTVALRAKSALNKHPAIRNARPRLRPLPRLAGGLRAGSARQQRHDDGPEPGGERGHQHPPDPGQIPGLPVYRDGQIQGVKVQSVQRLG